MIEATTVPTPMMRLGDGSTPAKRQLSTVVTTIDDGLAYAYRMLSASIKLPFPWPFIA